MKKHTPVLVILIMLFSVTIYSNAEDTLNEKEIRFQQNNKYTGFLDGDYDKGAYFPTEYNWSFQSKMKSITKPKVKWEFSSEGIEEFESTPIIGSDGTIYVRGGNYLFAISIEGKEKWKKEVGHAFYAPVISSDGNLFISGIRDKITYLYKISPSGDIIWKKNIANSDGNIALDNKGNIYIGGMHGVLCINKEGVLVWEYFNKEFAVFHTPIISKDNFLYCLASNKRNDRGLYDSNSPSLIKLNIETGDIIKKLDFIVNEPHTPSIIKDSKVVLPGESISLYDGNINNKWRYQGEFYIIIPSFTTPVVSNDGTIYVSNGLNKLYALDSSGKMIWKNTLDKKYMGTSKPIMTSDGYIYILTSKDLYCFKSNGKIDWKMAIHYEEWCFNSDLAIGENGTIYRCFDRKGEDDHWHGVLQAIGGEMRK